MAFMYKQCGMVYILDLSPSRLDTRVRWSNPHSSPQVRQPMASPPQALVLTDAQVELSWSLAEFPGFAQGLHKRPRYRYSDVWQHFVNALALRAAASQASLLPQSRSMILGDFSIASLKTPHMPLVFPESSTLIFYGTPPSFASRAGGHFFRPPAALLSFMQSPFLFQSRPSTAPSAQPPGHSPPSAPSGNVFTTLSLACAFASTTVSAPHAASSEFPQPTPGLLLPLI